MLPSSQELAASARTHAVQPTGSLQSITGTTAAAATYSPTTDATAAKRPATLPAERLRAKAPKLPKGEKQRVELAKGIKFTVRNYHAASPNPHSGETSLTDLSADKVETLKRWLCEYASQPQQTLDMPTFGQQPPAPSSTPVPQQGSANATLMQPLPLANATLELQPAMVDSTSTQQQPIPGTSSVPQGSIARAITPLQQPSPADASLKPFTAQMQGEESSRAPTTNSSSRC